VHRVAGIAAERVPAPFIAEQAELAVEATGDAPGLDLLDVVAIADVCHHLADAEGGSRCEADCVGVGYAVGGAERIERLADRDPEAANRAGRAADVEQHRRIELIGGAPVVQAVDVDVDAVGQFIGEAAVDAVPLRRAGRIDALGLGVIVVTRQRGDVEGVVGEASRSVGRVGAVEGDRRSAAAKARGRAEIAVTGETRQDVEAGRAGADGGGGHHRPGGQRPGAAADRLGLVIATRQDNRAALEAMP
jgi:hypothetical protein